MAEKKGNWYTRHFGFKPLPGTGTVKEVVTPTPGWSQSEVDHLVKNIPDSDQRESYPGHGKTVPSDQGEGSKEKAAAEKAEAANKKK